MNQSNRLNAFSTYGIELEYMLVDRDTLDVRPVADLVLETATGKPTSDFESGDITWSNELALHVIELKGTYPTPDLPRLAHHFQSAIAQLKPALDAHNVILLPTGMHPWMNPATETRLWPHECGEIYQAYHQLFNCHAHGWSNVQSVHLNLPFMNDQQFASLHAATRLLLPILPALTASSPVMDGKRADWNDMRMQMVRDHCKQVPFLTGAMVPEPIYDEATYRKQIFARLEKEIAPHDSAGVFDPNFLNARGAIARFDRGSIEIRVMDVQESPQADIAVCVASIATLKALTSERWQSLDSQKQFPTEPLSKLLDQVSIHSESTVIENVDFLNQFGVGEPLTAGELWDHILACVEEDEPMMKSFRPVLNHIRSRGSLSSRIASQLVGSTSDDGTIDRQKLRDVYRKLSSCLETGSLFLSQ